ncbi:MAG: hypothetical protein IJW63_06995 [Lachnospiraceae bacterium]|nr:hypothetical protein [Lachnospiraceae bacterium]
MLRRFELWLDESGDFFKEKEKRMESLLPSLIGGLLVPVEKVSAVLRDAMVESERNHANRLTDVDKREYVLPILKKLAWEHDIWQVFFENSQYEDAPSNRHLYLRLMAEGILQLMQKLDGLYESVELCVWIAQRQDVHCPNPERRRIGEAEYIAALKRVMEQRKKEHSILFNEGSKVHFVVVPAGAEMRIQLADFACNTRLTRFSEAFDGVREEVERLYEKAHIFDLHESRSENYIKICMEKGDVADALMELFTTWEPLDRAEQIDYVLKSMQNNSKEQNEVLLKQCTTEIETYLYAQDDYQMGELFLRILLEELVPKLKEYQLPYQPFVFRLQMSLIELFTKLGNTIAARKVLRDCKSNLSGSLEQIGDLWLLLSKEALLCYDEGKQLEAEQIMASVCESQRNLKEFLEQEQLLEGYEIEQRMEGYGSALSMYIYVMLSRHKEPSAYQKLSALLEEAMLQFGASGAKRERLCRYRSLLEAKAGHVESALQWLFGVEKVVDDYTFRQQCSQYLKTLQLRKDSRDIQFGVMYYLEILNEARVRRESLSRTMAGALGEQHALLEYLGIRNESESLPNEVDTTGVSQKESGCQNYHPLEQIYGLYADYLMSQNRNEEAHALYRKAIEICFGFLDYVTMNIAGLRIVPRFLECLTKMGNKEAAEYEREVCLEQVDLLLKQPLEDETRALIVTLSAF